MRFYSSVLTLSSVLIAGGLAAGAAAPPQEAGEVQTESRSFTTSSGEEVAFDLGAVQVPENRSDPDSRLIGVGFARIPAVEQPPKAPPIFLLPGGPGSSFVQLLLASGSSRSKEVVRAIDRYRRISDVVLVDQRGCSRQGDMLIAALPVLEHEPDHPPTLDDEVEHWREFARTTVKRFEERDIDLRGYTVKECARDVAAVRAALGYEKVSLIGTSFGSQWSFAVMRLHPEIVARALLSGVEPLDHAYDMPSYVFAAMQRIWRELDADARFQPYLPEGGFAEMARVVIEKLEAEPWRVETVDEEGRRTLVRLIQPDDFPWSDPVQVLELYHGHLDRWQKPEVVGGSFLPLIGPLIDSSLGVTPERRHRLWTDPATRYLGRGNFARHLATAEIWPSPDVGDDFRTPEPCGIPVVFAQGDWDTSTPIENTFEIAPFFTNSHVLIARRGGHGVLEPIRDQLPEVWGELEEFLATGDRQDIPVRVLLRPSRRFSPPAFPPGETEVERGR